MKKNVLSIFLLCLSISAFSQITLNQIPETPLTYFGYEVTTPSIKAGYTSRTEYYGSKPAVIQTGLVSQKKYSDLTLYQSFSEMANAFSTFETQTIVSRTTNYVAYTLQIRDAAPSNFITYAKDTFFLSGTTITSISETIYDISTNGDPMKTYAQYDVFYNVNGKIERITLKDNFDGYLLGFAGLSVTYNANNTLKSDSLYRYNYYPVAGKSTSNVEIYKDYTYKTNDALKLDTTFYNQIGSTPLLNTKYTYTLNATNEITEVQKLIYSTSNKFEQMAYYDFGTDPSLGIINNTAATSISIYPNPAVDIINVPTNYNYTAWNITSIDGASIDKGNNSSNKIAIDNLKSGLYILTLTKNDQTWVGKFVK
jgi:hypothetical protein